MLTRRIYYKYLNQILYPILDIFFPAECYACRGELKKSPIPFFCEDCWSGIQPLEGPFCPQCGKPFSSSWALSFSPGHRCGNCRSDSPFFDRMVTPYPFDGVLSKGISLYKYHRKVSLISPMTRLFLPFLELIGNFDIILPVPLHVSRLREREFNQSLLLGDALGKILGKPVLVDILIKIKPTALQMKLSRFNRGKNLKHSIGISASHKVEGKTVLLVDDVFTTGSTMNECARILKKEGCRKVIGLALARTLMKN